MAYVNDIEIATPAEALDDETLRQRACTELLRQRAMALGLLPTSDPAPRDGAISQAASEAIEALIAQELAGTTTPTPGTTPRASGCGCATSCSR